MAVISNALIAVGFPTMHGADEVMLNLAKAAESELVELEDAAVVMRRPDGTFKVKQTSDFASEGLVGGSLTGLLVGSLLLSPAAGLAGAVAGGALGASAGSVADLEIEEDFVEGVGQMMEPGTSAVFVYVKHATGDRGIATLQKHGAKLLQTTLPEFKEEQLRAKLEEKLRFPKSE